MKGTVAVVTDSNSGISVAEGEKMGVFVIPMPINIDGKVYYEGLNLSQDYFYQCMAAGAEMFTSQPSPADTLELWNRVLRSYDQLVYIPMSAGLSSTYATARMMADDFQGRVQVVDNRRISLPQRQSVLDALVLAKKGLSAVQIKQSLEENALKASVYLTVDTLKYLKKGGRVTPAAAAIGTVLNIKPLLQIQGGGIDAFGKVRGLAQAQEKLLDALCADLTGRFAGMPMHIGVAYSGAPEVGKKWQKYVQERFPRCKVQCSALGLSIACHTGPGALGVGCYYYEE